MARVQLIVALSVALSCAALTVATQPFTRYNFWLDYPGSAEYSANTQWYDLIKTAAGSAFKSGGNVIELNWADKKAIHMYADPKYQQMYDDIIRKLNGEASSTMSGTIDSCGWPADPPSVASEGQQWTRRTSKYYEDFSNGLTEGSLLIANDMKGCCEVDWTKNVNIAKDTVDGVVKNVLTLTAYNEDVNCGSGQSGCRKIVRSAGMVKTADHFASGRYEVVAKVPKASGLIWAVWTYHYEEHLPTMCDRYTCFCGDGGATGCYEGKCMPSSLYNTDGCPGAPLGPCTNSSLCDAYWNNDSPQGICGREHLNKGADPLFMGSTSFGGYITQVNHEIDIEIPAGCVDTPNVCPGGLCEGDYNTANFNNYIFTNGGGGGPAYTNMCVRVTDGAGQPVEFLGDGQYHKYRFDWHSGSGTNASSSYVDFFIDDVYMGTNNAFVPTRGSRFAVAFWGGGWNGQPNDWGGGQPGDGQSYTQTAYVSSIKVEPFNEPNDVMYMSIDDQPDGCAVPYDRDVCHEFIAGTIPPVVSPAPPTTDDDDDHGGTTTDDDHASCAVATNRPLGCACNHSGECASDWCAGVPSTCTQHP